ncbi:MAG: hypothetical protein HQK86_13650 [Nitrospinae bacterium]|nr:hypothetical protein [Nitrospinota bacterium]
MIKRFFGIAALISTLCVGVNCHPAYAEDALPKSAEVEKLKDAVTPSYPAFAVLDADTTSVSKPTTPREVGINLINAAKGANTGVSIAPYWLFGLGRGISFDDYFGKKDTIPDAKQVGQSIAQNLEISMVTRDMEDDKKSKGMGLGVRTFLLKGRPSENAIRQKDFVQTLLNGKVPQELQGDFGDKSLNDLLSYKTDDLKNAGLDKTLSCDQIKTKIKELNDKGDFRASAKYELAAGKCDSIASFTTEILRISKLLSNETRVGWIVEVGAATSRLYEGSNINKGKGYKNGYWLNVTYTTEDKSVDLLAVARKLDDIESGESATDIGARVIFNNPFKVSEKLSASAEYMGRFTTDSETASKYAMIVEYRIDSDVYLTGSLGKNFENTKFNPTSNDAIISLIGLNWGFGDKPSITVNKN